VPGDQWLLPTSNHQTLSMTQESEIDLFGISNVLRRYKLLVGLTTLFFGVASAVLALMLTPRFEAQVSVTEARDDSLGGPNSLTGSLGGLASLAGVDIMANSASRDSLALLKSRRLVEEYITRNNLAPALFEDSAEPARLWFAVEEFRKNVLSIREDSRSGVTFVVVEWTDPKTAATWANGLVALVNELTRTRALEESKRNISYLKGQIEQTNVVELQKVMYKLIETETKTAMLANGRPEYAFTVVDPAVPPAIRTSPRRTVIVALGIVLGFLAGAVLAFVHNSLARDGRALGPAVPG
jgi:uncharacterized protein involved in exopolysaccharide biosynthesis